MNEIRVLLEQLMNGVAGLGFFAPIVFVLIFVIGTTCFVPTAILTLSAGALFGVPIGFVLSLITSLIGASGVFLAGRYLSRGWVAKKIAANQKIKAIDDAVSKKGWKLVLLLRFSAILPFSVLNYSLGLSNIRFRNYFLASLAGMAPGIFLCVYLGSLAGKMVFEPHPPQKTPIEWALVAVSFIATLAVGFYSAILVKKAIQTPIPR